MCRSQPHYTAIVGILLLSVGNVHAGQERSAGETVISFAQALGWEKGSSWTAEVKSRGGPGAGGYSKERYRVLTVRYTVTDCPSPRASDPKSVVTLSVEVHRGDDVRRYLASYDHQAMLISVLDEEGRDIPPLGVPLALPVYDTRAGIWAEKCEQVRRDGDEFVTQEVKTEASGAKRIVTTTYVPWQESPAQKTPPSSARKQQVGDKRVTFVPVGTTEQLWDVKAGWWASYVWYSHETEVPVIEAEQMAEHGVVVRDAEYLHAFQANCDEFTIEQKLVIAKRAVEEISGRKYERLVAKNKEAIEARIALVGKLKAELAIPRLIELIAFPPEGKGGSPAGVQGASYDLPAVTALKSIGPRCLKACKLALAAPDTPADRVLYLAWVIASIENQNVAVEWAATISSEERRKTIWDIFAKWGEKWPAAKLTGPP